MSTENINVENDKTQVDESKVSKVEVNKNKGVSGVKKVAMGAGTGVLVGSLSSFMGASAMAAELEMDKELIMPEGEEVIEPIDSVDLIEETVSDGEVPFATSVNDEMSFGKAFAAARSEVGSGGAFEWRGNIYSTFTAEEWDSMSQEDIDEYNSHFNWETSGDDEGDSNISMSDNGTLDTDDVEVVDIAENDVIEDAEIEILGFVHDEESGYDIGLMLVDDQEVYLVDVDPIDGNGEFDYLLSDINGDGEITDNEMMDVSDMDMDVDTFSDLV